MKVFLFAQTYLHVLAALGAGLDVVHLVRLGVGGSDLLRDEALRLQV